MIAPTITAFKRALSSPQSYFYILKQIEPVLQNGRIVVNRTALAAECKVRLNGVLYMMYMPFLYKTVQRLAELESRLHNIDSAIICHNKVYYNELLVGSYEGRLVYCDIILQKIPEGQCMTEVISRYTFQQINLMIQTMSCELDYIGFSHNHLTPENIIVSNEPRMYPIRYWYATLSKRARNQSDILCQYAKANDYSNFILDNREHPFDTGYKRQEPLYYEGLTHFYRHKRVGFKDMSGREVIPPIYYAATHFLEDRALVSKRLRKGVINKKGKEIIPIVFESLIFDASQNYFVGVKEGREYTYDYNGKLVSRVRCDDKTKGGGILAAPNKE